MRTLIATTITIAVLVLSGCAATFALGNPWNPDEARFFDDGIDILDDVAKLSGQWAFDAEEELKARTHLANLVAEISIASVQTNQDVSGLEEKRIQVTVDNILYGAAPESDITLISNQNAKGYTLINRHEDQLNGKHLLFVRWFQKEDGSLGHHFHLSPQSAAIRTKINKHIETRIKAENTPVN